MLAHLSLQLCAVDALAQGATANPDPVSQPTVETRTKSLGLQAAELAREGKKDQALSTLSNFRALVGENALYFEAKGTVLTLLKDYPGAEAAFAQMMSRAPDSYVARFNRAEVILLQGRYAKAESEFAVVEEDRRAKAPATADLARFKRVACHLALGNMLDASRLVPAVAEDGESPAVRYARAMIAWVRKDAGEANRLIAEARKEFSREVDDLYTDTFVELKWGERGADGSFAFGLKSPLR